MTRSIVTKQLLPDRIEYRDRDGTLLCDCCASSIRMGASDYTYVPAVWMWHHRPTGNVSQLCDSCFEGFMKNAVKEPDLAPASYHRVRA